MNVCIYVFIIICIVSSRQGQLAKEQENDFERWTNSLKKLDMEWSKSKLNMDDKNKDNISSLPTAVPSLIFKHPLHKVNSHGADDDEDD